MEVQASQSDNGHTFEFAYRLFVPIDSNDEWVEPPFDDESVCFRKEHLQNLKASDEEMADARRALAE